MLSVLGCALCLCQLLSLYQILPELGAVCLVCLRVRPQWGLAEERLGGEEEAGSPPANRGHLDGKKQQLYF